MITIVDYGMGNLRSVQKAFESLGLQAQTSEDPDVVRKAAQVVVPGVGAFPDAMAHLRERGMDAAVQEVAKAGTPLLGVCLGMQLFFDHSEEYGDHEGLGLFPGRVLKFPDDLAWQGERLKVPHMGWNELRVRHPALRELDGMHVYFVHSYYVAAANDAHVAATCEYGIEFCAMASRDNIVAAQFHPEKSGAVGLRLLELFAAEAIK